ncbi:MAG: YueI family protein [Bacillota bacterium]
MSSDEDRSQEDKKEEIRQEAIKEQQSKSKLEQTVAAGMHGDFEFKKGEKQRFLGEFRERVIKVLTFDQISEPGVYPEILTAIKDSEAQKLIISQQADLEAAQEYIDLAREVGVSFKKVNSAEFKGDYGLVVVSDQAVNYQSIEVQPKTEKFKELGLPVELVNQAGDKICADCYEQLSQAAPEELINYEKLGFFDKLIGMSCSCDN